MWKLSLLQWLNTWAKQAVAEARSLAGTAITLSEAATTSFAYKKGTCCCWWGFWLCGVRFRQLCPLSAVGAISKRWSWLRNRSSALSAPLRRLPSALSHPDPCEAEPLCRMWACFCNTALWSQLSFSSVARGANKSTKSWLIYIWSPLPWCQWPWQTHGVMLKAAFSQPKYDKKKKLSAMWML